MNTLFKKLTEIPKHNNVLTRAKE